MSHGVTVLIITDNSDKTIAGIWQFDRTLGGRLVIPSGNAFPTSPAPIAKELFWRTDESILYRRNDTNDAWDTIIAEAEAMEAENVSVNTEDFVGILSETDSDVQTALETLDVHSHNNEITAEVDCSAGDAVGDLVYVTSNINLGKWQVSKADPYNRDKMPAVGSLIYKDTSTTGIVQFFGEVADVYTALDTTTGKRTQFVGFTGPINYPPDPSEGISGYAIVQPIGLSLSTNVLLLLPSMNYTLRR